MDITDNDSRGNLRPGALIALILAVGLVLGLWLFPPSRSDGAPAGDGDVHHPECADRTVDLAPGASTPAAGIVWIKAGPDHVSIGHRPAGFVIPAVAPNGKDTSHGDVCGEPDDDDPPRTTTTTEVPPSTTTTLPTTTTITVPVTDPRGPTTTSSTSTTLPTPSTSSPSTSTPTTVPPGTAPSSTSTTVPDPCATGCVSPNPPAVDNVCRDGAVIEIHPSERRASDSDDLANCRAVLPSTR